jgi:methylglutaconyl-CoA hydratase
VSNYETLELHKEDGIATVTLNRPDIHNAFNETLIQELTQVFSALGQDEEVWAIIFTGRGASFCAGADLNWMKKMVSYTREQNIADSLEMSAMFEAIDTCPKPVIGRINGSAFGGALGLICACDLAIGLKDSLFAFSEVKLGIIPAVISPYVVRKLGLGKTRELFVTGERVSGEEAARIGLLNHVVATEEELDVQVVKKLKFMRSSGKLAMKESKVLLRTMEEMDVANFRQFTAEKIAELRSSEEGQEGLAAFLEKRKPSWRR